MRWAWVLVCAAACARYHDGTDFNLTDAERAICWGAGGAYRCVIDVPGKPMAEREALRIKRAPIRASQCLGRRS